MKRCCAVLLALLCLLTAGGASAVTFMDDLGRTVTVDKPERTAALLGSFAQVWHLAGGEVCAAADDAWEDFGLPMAADAVNLGNTKALSLETLLAARPDFILASANTRQNLEWLDVLTATGIPTAYFDVADFGDYLRLLDVCTRITGRRELYEQHGLCVQERIDRVLARCKERAALQGAPKVLSLRASAASILAKNSEDNVLGEMLRNMGCHNIADGNALLLENLSVEYILQEDPAYIFIVQRGDDAEGTRAAVQQMMAENPAWAQLTAVKEGRVYYMDKRLFSLKPNHCWGEAYEVLEGLLWDE